MKKHNSNMISYNDINLKSNHKLNLKKSFNENVVDLNLTSCIVGKLW